ncbi:peptidoglycan-binding protein [Candidatus Kaiserbacteria bacterium]|nr:peptidoglycan-binding protein [Candidatus Kaiserbacteria bacterium]
MLPAASYALTNEEVRSQINALLVEIAQLQRLLDSLPAGSAATPSSSGGSVICSLSRYPLARGATGRDVGLVQEFLKSLGFFSGTATSFFGPLTERALTDFQLQRGIISERSEGGVFGRRTFNYVLGRFCTSPISGVSPSALPVTPVAALQQCNTSPATPGVACTGTWVKTYSSECHVGWTCVASSTSATAGTPSNKPPLISAVIGPTLLKPDESGTWNVDATDPEGQPLLYSMVWGDEGSALPQILNIAREGTRYSSQASYTHTYSKTGAYTIVAFVKDAAGNDTSASLSVQVRTPEPIGPPLSADGSCVLNGKTTKNTEMIPNPSCSGTCAYPYLQCISGQWVALPSAAGAESGSSACYMNGTGHAAETIPAQCRISDQYGAGSGPNTGEQCRKFLSGEMTCTENGWAGISWGGGHINPSYVTVGCTAANTMASFAGPNVTIYVPGNMRVQGNRCATDDSTQTNCDANYVCKRDGWWSVDSFGNETRKETKAPYIYPENFYPKFAPAY